MKEIALTERAKQALKVAATEQSLRALASKFTDLTVVKDKPDLALAMSALSELRATRVNIEKTGKAAREDATAFQKAVIAEEKRLIGIIQPEEHRIKELRESYEAEQERIRAEAARKEAERIAGIRYRIDQPKWMVVNASGGPSSEIAKLVDALAGIEIDESYQEFQAEAAETLSQAKDKAATLYSEAVAREEAEAERVAREKAESERRRIEAEAEEKRRQAEAAELARAKAEQERIAAQLREQQEAIERERREAQQKRQAEQAERERIAAEERAEIERQRAEIARQKAEWEAQERARVAAEQQRREKAEAERKAKEQPVTLEAEIDQWARKYRISEAARTALNEIVARHCKAG